MRAVMIWALACIASACMTSAVGQGFNVVYTAAVHPRQVDVVFSLPLNPASASDINNYHLSNTKIVVTNAIVRSDNVSVSLQLSGPIVGHSFILLLGDVRAATGAELSSHIATGLVMAWSGLLNLAEIGGATGSVFAGPARHHSEFSVSTAGGDIGGTHDRFLYVYHRGSAYSMITASITPPNQTFGKTGLMARESLDPGSRFFGVFIERRPNGFEISMLQRDQTNGPTVPWAAAQTVLGIPALIRLHGDGTNFRASMSENGFDFTTLGQTSPAFTPYPQEFSMGVVTVGRFAASEPDEINYSYWIEPHGDAWPIANWSRTNEFFQLRWSSLFILYESSSISPFQWTPVTNHIDFGLENRWNIDVRNESAPRFFRLMTPFD